MKNLLLTVATILSTISVFAQAPQAINYQAVVRNTTGDVIKNQNVRFKLSITEGVAGTTTYAETQQATTSNLGLVNLTIGSGTVATGTFSAVNWATGNKFLKIEIDATGGTTYALMGTQQLVSVPYALHAATSGAVANQWQFNSSGINYNTGNVGIGTTTPNYALHIERDGDAFTTSTLDQRTMLFLQNTATNAAANTNLKIGSAGTTGTTNLSNFTPNYNVVPGYANCGMLSNTGGGLILQSVQSMRFKVGANTPDRMTITADGNVGVGTSTPVSKLQLEGSEDGDGRNFIFIKNYSTSTYGSAGIGIQSGTSSGETRLWHISPEYAGRPQDQDFGTLFSTGKGISIWSSNKNNPSVGKIKLQTGASQGFGIDRLVIDETGNTGIGTSAPKAKLEIANGDVYVNDATKGIVLKSPNGSCWRVTVDNTGNLVRTSMTCPQ